MGVPLPHARLLGATEGRAFPSGHFGDHLPCASGLGAAVGGPPVHLLLPPGLLSRSAHLCLGLTIPARTSGPWDVSVWFLCPLVCLSRS